jgi:hypothetical protein
MRLSSHEVILSGGTQKVGEQHERACTPVHSGGAIRGMQDVCVVEVFDVVLPYGPGRPRGDCYGSPLLCIGLKSDIILYVWYTQHMARAPNAIGSRHHALFR